MSPQQYHFPYFFNLKRFNKLLRAFNLSSYIAYDDKMPKELILTKRKFLLFNKEAQAQLLAIPFGYIIMITNNDLYYWDPNKDKLTVNKVNLGLLYNTQDVMNDMFDIDALTIGLHNVDTTIVYNDFVTFVRKNDLKYDQPYFEQYIIIIMNGSTLEILPFEWFNKVSGDYGYVWPAIARLDRAQNKLYGQGMRMTNFIVDLDHLDNKPLSDI